LYQISPVFLDLTDGAFETLVYPKTFTESLFLIIKVETAICIFSITWSWV